MFLLLSWFPSSHTSPRVQVPAAASFQSTPSPINSQSPSASAPAPFLYSWSLLNSQCSASLLSQPPFSSSFALWISVSVTQTTSFSLGQLWSPLHLTRAASSATVLGIRRNSRCGIIVLCFDAWLWLSSQALWSSLAIVCAVPLQHDCSLTSMR